MRSISLKIPLLIPDLFYQLCVFVLLRYRVTRYGYPFRRIRLTQGQYAIVDPEDYESLSKYQWNLMKCKHTQYAVRIDNGFSIIHMHRQLMHQQLATHHLPPTKLVVHHINHNGLDNRRINLRIVTYRQNAVCNRPLNRGTSKYKGVWWHKQRKKWAVSLKHNRKKVHIGVFKDEIEAAKAYDKAAKKYHGDLAYLNFPCPE